jgi:hypothetical protein
LRVKKELNTDEVERMKGSMSQVLTDRCPDRLVVFPSNPCSNIACEYAIQQPGYMNCSFVASEAGEHTLEAIGEMMGITREGVRLIEVRAMKKLRAMLAEEQQPDDEQKTTPHKPRPHAGRGDVRSLRKKDELTNRRHFLPVVDDRKLGELTG